MSVYFSSIHSRRAYKEIQAEHYHAQALQILYGRLRAMRTMKTVVLLTAVLMILIAAPSISHAKKPTGTVIDEETGKPVEGAVAICIWRRGEFSLNGFLEGGFEVVSKIVETTSDKDGNFYIPGYWGINIISQPNLNVYKFGYVLWDSNSIFMDGERSDFNKNNRIVKLQKWPKKFSFVEHSFYINATTGGNYSEAKDKIFFKAVRQELPFKNRELDTRDNKKLDDRINKEE